MKDSLVMFPLDNISLEWNKNKKNAHKVGRKMTERLKSNTTQVSSQEKFSFISEKESHWNSNSMKKLIDWYETKNNNNKKMTNGEMEETLRV